MEGILEVGKLLSGLTLCIAGLYEQRKAYGSNLFDYICGGQLWIAGMLAIFL